MTRVFPHRLAYAERDYNLSIGAVFGQRICSGAGFERGNARFEIGGVMDQPGDGEQQSADDEGQDEGDNAEVDQKAGEDRAQQVGNRSTADEKQRHDQALDGAAGGGNEGNADDEAGGEDDAGQDIEDGAEDKQSAGGGCGGLRGHGKGKWMVKT